MCELFDLVDRDRRLIEEGKFQSQEVMGPLDLEKINDVEDLTFLSERWNSNILTEVCVTVGSGEMVWSLTDALQLFVDDREPWEFNTPSCLIGFEILGDLVCFLLLAFPKQVVSCFGLYTYIDV